MADELCCFMDHARICGADCTAYLTVPDANRQLDSTQAHCLLLSSVERTGRSLNIIGNLLDRLEKRLQDQQRTVQPPPPNPMGSR